MNNALSRIFEILQKTGREEGKLSSGRVIRLVIAAVLFAVVVVVKMPAFAEIILLVVSLFIAAFDLGFAVFGAFKEKKFLAAPLIVLVAAILSFFIGFAREGVAMAILYQLGQTLIAYIDDRARKSAASLLDEADRESAEQVAERLKESGCEDLKLGSTLVKSSSVVLTLLMVFAVAYAVVMLFLGDFSLSVSLHRALMILLLCMPFSVAASIPITALNGLCFSAQQGIAFNKASAMEDVAYANTAVFDKAGIFSQGEPRLLSLQSDYTDYRGFMNFVAHAVYYSEQPFSRAIASAYTLDYKLDVISNFKEIPGKGVELKIADNSIILAVYSVFAERGIRVPQEQSENGQYYFMTINGRYFGKVLISDSINDDARGLSEEVQDSGIRRCVLLTEEGEAESQELGEDLGFQEIHSECDTEKKLAFLSELKESGQSRVAYIYANGFEAHSAADVDIRVSKKAKYADAALQPDRLSNLPLVIRICKRMCSVVKHNAIFVMGVKAVLVFLSMLGYSNLWFVVFMDAVAAVATQLTASRVTKVRY